MLSGPSLTSLSLTPVEINREVNKIKNGKFILVLMVSLNSRYPRNILKSDSNFKN